jgi:hypothetical protein
MVDTMQVSSKLRRGAAGYFHWCPACEEMHPLPDTWSFDQNFNLPTFSPSFKHESTNAGSNAVCHYTLTGGILNYHNDCTHAMMNQQVPLPDLPVELCDPNFGQ